ncbi:MAG: hypothetical protein ACLFPS_02150 [Clostridia bacterium]
MGNKSNWLLGFIVAIILVAVVLYVISFFGPSSSLAEDHLGLYPIVIAIVVAPFVIAFISNSTPEQPVKGMIHACQTFEQARKFEAMRPFLSKDFLKSPKILLAIQWKPEKIKTIKTEVTEQKHKMIVRVTLKDEKYYVFTVTKRMPYVDPAGSTNWVVDEIKGI